jgi:prepilin-type processing-associated H-X9-DG protein
MLTMQEDSVINAQWAYPLPGKPGDPNDNPVWRNLFVCEQVFPMFRCPSDTFPAQVADISGDNWIVQRRAAMNYLGCVSGRLADDRRYQSVPTPWGTVGNVEVISDLDGVFLQKVNHQRIKRNGGHYGMIGIRMADITDGTSNTIALGEAVPDMSAIPEMGTIRENNQPTQGRKDHWGIGSDDVDTTNQGDMSEALGSTGVPMNQKKPAVGTAAFAAWEISFGSRHTGSAQFGMADGSVRFLTENIDARVYSRTWHSRRRRSYQRMIVNGPIRAARIPSFEREGIAHGIKLLRSPVNVVQGIFAGDSVWSDAISFSVFLWLAHSC